MPAATTDGTRTAARCDHRCRAGADTLDRRSRSRAQRAIGWPRCGGTLGVAPLACLIALFAGAPRLEAAADSELMTCADCHDEEAEQLGRSVHAAADVGCRDCHGGEERYDLGAMEQAFDHGKAFRGKPARIHVPELCGGCHSDVELMNPYGLRTDPWDRYKTSGHGKRLYADQDERVAVCNDCHGTHEVLRSKDPRSLTNPMNVPDMCGRCHADAALMSGYNLSGDVVWQYKESVHGQGLLISGDEAMPTCATCHGNHAARPPGFRDVGHVCAQCHQQTETYFKQSVHAKFPGFPPCVGCHAATPSGHDHRIMPVTRSPEELVMMHGPRWEQLLESGATQERIDEVLSSEMLEADADAVVRLRLVCARCHGEPRPGGHRAFLEEVDRRAMALGPEFDRMIRDAELRYLQTGARVDRVGRGVLLVQEEAFALEQARTDLIALAAIQHTLDEKRVTEALRKVLDVCRQINTSLDEKEARLRWRYWALLPMWAFLLLFICALWVKYKRLRKAYVVPITARREAGS